MYKILFFIIGITISWHNLYAAEEWRDNAQTLPQYCQDRAKGWEVPEYQRWKKTFGDVFVHMHHYCGGIYAEQKARGTIDPRQRERWMRGVTGQMEYVSRHCSTKCAFYPELHSRWGWALGETGQVGEAIEHFQLAIRAKPKYVPAYAKLADLYIEIEQPDEARRVLEEGLKAKPGSRMLQKRLKKLEDAP